MAQSADTEPTRGPISPEWKAEGGWHKAKEHFVRFSGSSFLPGKICGIFSIP